MRGLRESDLVAVRRPPGPAWAEVLRACWDAGAAVLPVDDRLPAPAVETLLQSARPTVVLDGDELRRRGQGAPVEAGIALAMATSGSTGTPKIVELTHTALASAVTASLRRLDARDEDPWLLCLPVAHMGGMLVVLRALRAGAPILTGDDARARFASVVPTQLARWQDEGRDLEAFRSILVGGDALDPARARANVVPTYGMTETCGGVVYGGVPLDGVQVAIEDDEIALGGPTLMTGYRFGERAGAWLRTGDAGRLVDGRLEVLGRLDERITTGGEKVWPAVVERALRAVPGVAEALVHGEPDPEWGARVVATIEARGDLDLGAVGARLREVLAPYEVPKEFRVVDALPRTPAGTVARR